MAVTWLEHVSLFEFFRGESAEFTYLNAVMVENLLFLWPVLGAFAADHVLESGWGGAAFRGDDGTEWAIEWIWHWKGAFLEDVVEARVSDELPSHIHLFLSLIHI